MFCFIILRFCVLVLITLARCRLICFHFWLGFLLFFHIFTHSLFCSGYFRFLRLVFFLALFLYLSFCWFRSFVRFLFILSLFAFLGRLLSWFPLFDFIRAGSLCRICFFRLVLFLFRLFCFTASATRILFFCLSSILFLLFLPPLLLRGNRGFSWCLGGGFFQLFLHQLLLSSLLFLALRQPHRSTVLLLRVKRCYSSSNELIFTLLFFRLLLLLLVVCSGSSVEM